MSLENILTKAKQKRHLDFLVMTEGNFSETSLFSAQGLKDVFGGAGGGAGGGGGGNGSGSATASSSSSSSSSGDGEGGAAVAMASAADIEAAMAAAEVTNIYYLLIIAQ